MLLSRCASSAGLLLRSHEVHRLLDRLDRRGDRRDLHADRVVQDRIGQLADLARHRRGEQQRLPLLREPCATILADVVDEAHVEHAVGFVEHEHLDCAQIDVALLHQVEQPAGRGDEDVDAALQRLDLRVLAHAAEDDGVAQRAGMRP